MIKKLLTIEILTVNNNKFMLKYSTEYPQDLVEIQKWKNVVKDGNAISKHIIDRIDNMPILYENKILVFRSTHIENIIFSKEFLE